MTARTFTMPKSLNESLATTQPPVSDPSNSNSDPKSTPKDVQDSYAQGQKEPLASHGVKEKPGITFAAQDSLAKLPIPELEGTLKRYQNALKPLQGRKEQIDTAAAAEAFLRGEGTELQARLKKYATGKTSYIEQFCMSSVGMDMKQPCYNIWAEGKANWLIQGTTHILISTTLLS